MGEKKRRRKKKRKKVKEIKINKKRNQKIENQRKKQVKKDLEVKVWLKKNHQRKYKKVEKESKVNTNPTPTNLSVQEKRKLLWGKKKQTEPKSNVWASANLGNDEQNKKLLKLMGVKNTDKIESTPKKNVLNPDAIKKRFDELEKGFEQGQKTRKNRGFGIGF